MTDQTNPGKQEVALTADITQAVSINTFVPIYIDGEFFKIQVTTRHGSTPEKIFTNFSNHVAALQKIRDAFPLPTKAQPLDNIVQPPDDFGYIPDIDAPQGVASPQQPTERKTFPAGRVSVEIRDGGKAYYKINAADGQKFPKFPVTVWPEVLAAIGIDANKINPVDPASVPNLTGWIAEYEMNEKGNPRKVTKLVKAN
jgi:hypothetical protein